MEISFFEVTATLFQGFGTTILLFAITLLASLPLGLLVCFCSMSKFAPIKYLTKVLTWIIRGTPLMLQIFVVFYLPGLVFKVPMRSRFLAVSVAFIINYAFYFSEIYRGGIESISKGQYEAGQVLGLKKSQIFFTIVLPQVFKRIMAPISNEVITLVKDTSLSRIIMVKELIMEAETITAVYGIVYPLFYTGAFYLLFSGVLTLALGKIEKKMAYYN